MSAGGRLRSRFALLAGSLALAACAGTPGTPGTHKKDPGAHASAALTPLTLPLRAGGNEPPWRMLLDGRFRLETGYERSAFEASLPPAEALAAGQRWRVPTPEGLLQVEVTRRTCNDSMSGMPHPYTVTLERAGRRLAGCGGEPAALLRGLDAPVEWVVEDIDGARLAADARGPQDARVDHGARPSLRFGGDGRVSGRSACNRYSAAYTLDGERLAIGAGAGTRMACAPALMQLESRFLAALAAVQGFAITDEGALELRGAGGRSIRARAHAPVTPAAPAAPGGR
jgi:heat shock protein HslJ/uncharacterized membrane protein